jgi:hypothetical protein
VRKITIADIKNIAEYEEIRDQFRRHVIELKKRRRVQVGGLITLVFENRDTVLFQIQEMMRAERIVRREQIQAEIDVYNELLPGEDELSATMFIEIGDMESLRQWLPKLVGIEEKVWLRLGDRHLIHADYEPGRSKDDITSTVHYLRFKLTPEEVRAFLDESLEAAILIEHQNYRAEGKISPDARRALAEDFVAGGS